MLEKSFLNPNKIWFMMSAILLNRNGIDVTIIEKNSTLGKKILMTGNGRCNYFNDEINIDKYYTSDYEFLKKIINDILIYHQEILSFFYFLLFQ